MIHLAPLIHDLALILISAGFVTVLFRKLSQPVVLGYLLAGLLVGPHVTIFPTVTDRPSIQIWADIGVIFLLFALGLEFSFKKLLRVGGAASITAIVEVTGMTLLGYFAGRAFGWSPMDCLFLGGIIAISSTTIIIRAIDEIGFKQRGFVNLVFGILVVEDLIAVLLMVLLSTIALTGSVEGTQLFWEITKLAFFTVIWFVAGIFILPSVLKSMRRHTNEETLLIVSLGLCFSMVVVTTKVGFSPALGAFFMGSMLAETNDAERIEQMIRPVKNLFAAIFFVSVGMLIDPNTLIQYWGPITVLTFLVIFGKVAGIVLGALISGRNLRHSIQTGFSLSQIGEFSFIIAALGLSLKVTSDFLYPVAVGVSAITTFTTPYMIRSADKVHFFVERNLPPAIRKSLLRYEVSTHRVSTRKEWKSAVRSYALSTMVNSVVIIGIFTSIAQAFPLAMESVVGDRWLVDFLGLVTATVISAPFFWALVLRRANDKEIAHLWRYRENRSAIVLLEALRLFYGMTLFGGLATRFITFTSEATLTGALMVVLLIGFAKHLRGIHTFLEKRFLRNLSEREQVKDGVTSPLVPWDAHMARFEVSPTSEVVGKTLEELRVRERFGVTIALIERGSMFLTAPTRSTRIFPGDKVSVIGTDEQIHPFGSFLKINAEVDTQAHAENYSLHQVKITDQLPFSGRTIRESGIREKTDGLVVGIERDTQRILNPDSSTVIEPGDLLWIVGDSQKLKLINPSP